jgi:superfamily II DNA helicase RecQ
MSKTKLIFKKPNDSILKDSVETDPLQPNATELKSLKKYFGFNNFRSGQWRIIRILLRERRDVCGILATGQGKSLCYQFPAVLSEKTVIVISPLISLMQDQKMALLAKNIPSEALCGLTKNYTDTLDKVVRGEYRVVYTTPEFISTHLGVLTRMAENDILEMIAIDEAHCISQWGHDFRPSYRTLTGIRQHIPPNIPILALTATATPVITQDICDNLSLRNVEIIRASTDRPNLRLWVHKKSPGGWLPDLKKILGSPTGATKSNNNKSNNSSNRGFIISDDEDEPQNLGLRNQIKFNFKYQNNDDEDMGFEDDDFSSAKMAVTEEDLPDLNTVDVLTKKEEEPELVKEPVPIGHADSTIIYTNSRKDCEAIYKDLKRVGYHVDYYHAGMNDKRRMEVHKDFIYDKVPIVVATIAFGMGIDKPSIRKIINWGLPGNIETYYQEIGRAGRDGLESDCYLFYNSSDMFIHKFLIGKMECTKQVQDHHYHLLELMKQFTFTNVCRQYQLAQYFQGDNMVNAAPTDPDEISKFCKVCDNCQHYFDRVMNNENVVVDKVDVGKNAKILIDLVRTLSTNYGFKNLIGILTGSKAKTFPERLKQCTYYGRGDHRSQVYWKALGDVLITEGYLKYSKIGGLYGFGKKQSKKQDQTQVMQVVTVGPKRMDGETLVLIPTPELDKCLKSYEHEKKIKQIEETNKTGQLMQLLKNFRSEISAKMNLPPYIVLPDTVINALLQVKLPTDISQLALVDGLNTQVLMMHGDDLVGLMNRTAPVISVRSNMIDSDDEEDTVKSNAGGVKKKKSDDGDEDGKSKPSYILNSSVLETKTLYDTGLGVKEIATRRKMSTSTIEAHIATLFATCDDMDYTKIIDEEKKEQIKEFLRLNPSSKFKELKDGLQVNDITASYMEIKLVLALMSRGS